MDTPRTDAYMSRAFDGSYNEFIELADFARQLERENAELREALAKFASIDSVRDGFAPNERVRKDFLDNCPEYIGYAKAARALLK